MPRQEIDGLCIKVNEEFNMGEQYFKGVLAGYLGANFMCGPITEWQILETLREQATKVERMMKRFIRKS